MLWVRPHSPLTKRTRAPPKIIHRQRPTVKLFTFYCENHIKNSKSSCLEKAIAFTRSNYTDDTKWFIERTEEYRGFIKPKNLIKKSSYTIIPDLFCGLFAKHLDSVDKKDAQDENLKIAYNRIRNLIRLQAFWVGGKQTILRRAAML